MVDGGCTDFGNVLFEFTKGTDMKIRYVRLMARASTSSAGRMVFGWPTRETGLVVEKDQVGLSRGGSVGVS